MSSSIPLDVIVIDFYHWPYCGDWRFDEEFFPDPAAMIKELQELGVETMVSIWPAVDCRSENYEEMKQQNMLVKSNSGVDVQMIFHGNNAFMDATNPCHGCFTAVPRSPRRESPEASAPAFSGRTGGISENSRVYPDSS